MLKDTHTEFYLNYSGFVKLRLINQREIERLDFAYELMPNGLYKAVIPHADCFIVENKEMFSGYGSLCTSMHSCYGKGRDVESLIKEVRRKNETDIGTSGHMIAASLMYRCHLLTYLNEVLINNTTKTSIYNLTVVEPASGLYHTKQEYKNAILDIERLIQQLVMNKFTRRNLHIIKLFVETLM